MVKASQRNKTCRLYRRLDSTEPIGFTMSDINGTALDLTGRTVTMNGWDMDTGSSAFSGASVSVTDAANGKVSWTPDASHVATERDIALHLQDDTGRQFPWDGARFILEVRSAGAGEFG